MLHFDPLAFPRALLIWLYILIRSVDEVRNKQFHVIDREHLFRKANERGFLQHQTQFVLQGTHGSLGWLFFFPYNSRGRKSILPLPEFMPFGNSRKPDLALAVCHKHRSNTVNILCFVYFTFRFCADFISFCIEDGYDVCYSVTSLIFLIVFQSALIAVSCLPTYLKQFHAAV